MYRKQAVVCTENRLFRVQKSGCFVYRGKKAVLHTENMLFCEKKKQAVFCTARDVRGSGALVFAQGALSAFQRSRHVMSCHVVVVTVFRHACMTCVCDHVGGTEHLRGDKDHTVFVDKSLMLTKGAAAFANRRRFLCMLQARVGGFQEPLLQP